MGRSSGYRGNKANREQVDALRERLSQLRSHEWQKAGLVMDQITSLIGKTSGPSSGRIEPRACRYCSYYGHTKQHCAKRKRAVEREIEAELERDKMELEWQPDVIKPMQLGKFWRTQEEYFDSVGIAWERDPHLGAMAIRTVKIAEE